MDMTEQLNLFSSYVEFSPEFYQLLVKLRKNHPPVDQQSLWNIDSALASDVYCWLQRRMQSPSLDKPCDLSWTIVYSQFGRGEQLSKFKISFTKALQTACEQIRVPSSKGIGAIPAAATVSNDGIRIYPAGQQVKSKPASGGW